MMEVILMESWWGKDNENHTFIFNQPISLKEKLEHLEEITFLLLLFSSFIIPSEATYFINAIHWLQYVIPWWII